MSLWRQLTRGLRVLTNRREADNELDAEIRHYVEEAEAAAVADGLSSADARRAAQLEIGNMTIVREEVRAYGWEHAVGTLAADFRYAARCLRHSSGFTVVSAITLAVGIGSTTAIFSAVKTVLLERLPYPRANQIVAIADATADGERLDVTFGTYRELAQRSRGLEALAPFKPWQPTIVGQAEPERLSGERVGADFFRVLGVPPHIGRDFHAEDDRPNGGNVSILSDALWRRRFDADPTIVGRSITLDDAQYVVVGVMPRAFENVLAPTAELWAPLQYGTVFGPDSKEWGHHLGLLARTRPGVGVDAARQELNEIARAAVPEFSRVPWARLENGLMVTSLQADVTRAIRPALVAVLGGVILLLAIACVNVTNLLLARGAQRREEFAMRVALGAGRGRLFRQVLTESVVLSLVGGVLAMMVAGFALPALVALAPPELPRLGAIRLDSTIFVFALLLTMIVGAVVGVIPAMQAARHDFRARTRETSRSTAVGHRRMRRLLVVAEVAIALVLLTGAGLLFRSIDRIFAAPVGFDASGLLTMQVQQSGTRYRSNDARSRFYDGVIDAVRAVPGVSAAAFTSLVPLGRDIDMYGVRLEADPGVSEAGAAMRYAITGDYFQVMRIPLRSGRLLDARDKTDALRAAVINESFAKRQFAGREAVGQRLRFGPVEGDWYTIVGVVGDVKQSALDLSPPDAIYITAEQWHWVDTLMTVVVRGRGDAAALAPAIRSAIWSVDKDVPIVRVAMLDTLVERAIADRRFALVLFEAFGIAALILVTTGIYGVLSGGVTERMREIGVRSALGASPRAIVGLVARDGLAVATLGILVGLAGAAIASRALVALLFGISPLDPVTYGGVVALLIGASGIACAAPAYRAASIDPSVTLRGE